VDYHTAFELSPFEKQAIAEFIDENEEREMQIRSAMFGMKR
jgi:hypothetical protein